MKPILYMPFHYNDVYETYMYFHNKYWPGQQVERFPNKTPIGWTDKVIEKFNQIDDRHVILVPEDFFIFEPVDQKIMDACFEVAEQKDADKIELTGCFSGHHTDQVHEHNGVKFWEIPQDIPYRATLHPCIWKREYFLKVARPGQHWWRFEKCPRAVNDGGLIYDVEPPPIKSVLNFMWRGRANHKVFHRCHNEEDRKVIDALAEKYTKK